MGENPRALHLRTNLVYSGKPRLLGVGRVFGILRYFISGNYPQSGILLDLTQ